METSRRFTGSAATRNSSSVSTPRIGSEPGSPNTTIVGWTRSRIRMLIPLVRGEYVFFLNPDSELQPGTLERLLAELEGAPGRAAVGPRVRKGQEFMSRNWS